MRLPGTVLFSREPELAQKCCSKPNSKANHVSAVQTAACFAAKIFARSVHMVGPRGSTPLWPEQHAIST